MSERPSLAGPADGDGDEGGGGGTDPPARASIGRPVSGHRTSSLACTRPQ